MNGRTRPNRASVERPLSALGAVGWTLALLAIEHICVGVTEAARHGALTDIVNLTACDVLAVSIVLFAILRAHAAGIAVRDALGFRRLSILHVVLAAAAGAGLCPLLSVVDGRILARWPYEDPEILASIQKLVSSSPRVALVVGVFLIIPIARELFFRGAIYEALASRGAKAAVVVTAVLSTAFALDWRTMPSALLLGLALGWIRAQSGSVIAAIVLHVAFWSVDAVPILAGRDPAADAPYPSSWVVGCAAVAVAALIAARLTRSLKPSL